MSAPILPTSNRIQALRVQEFLREAESEAAAAPQQQQSSMSSQGFSSVPGATEPQNGIPGAPGQDGLPGAPGADGKDGSGVDTLVMRLSHEFSPVFDSKGSVISLPPGIALMARSRTGVFLRTRNGDYIQRG